MKAVAVVGPSDAGKTTLIERLVERLDGRVATVKSIHHDVEIDELRKDTYRHRRAGAETVVGITPSLTFTIRARGKDDAGDPLPELLDGFRADGYDYVLVEGFSASSLPKVAVGGADPGNVAARVSGAEQADVERALRAIHELPAWGGDG